MASVFLQQPLCYADQGLSCFVWLNFVDFRVRICWIYVSASWMDDFSYQCRFSRLADFFPYL